MCKKNLHLLLSLFFLLCFLDSIHSQNTYSKIHIVSDDEFLKDETKYDIGYVNSASSSLTYKSSESSYYNSCYLDTKKSSSILHEDYTINVSLNNIRPRGGIYTFSIPIRNSNAKTGYQYYSTVNPKLKQKVDDIYWGLVINVSHSGINESIVIWIKKITKDYYGTPYDYTNYNLNNNGWEEQIGYPNLEYEYSSNLEIQSLKYSNQSGIKWGDIEFFNAYTKPLPYYIDAINSIQVLVGCQADVKFGKGRIELGNYFGLASDYLYKAKVYLDEHYSKLSNYTKAEQYFSAESEAKKWIQNDGNTTEFNAFTLAYCQIQRNEYKDCIETCNSIINFRGDYLNQAYVLRGLCKEVNNDIQGALSDYNNAGNLGIDSYNKLIQRTRSNNNSQLQKSSKNSNPVKPQLRK